MEINVINDRKIVEVWLTCEEQRDRALKETLCPLYQQYKAKKYTVAVFLSGTQNLAEETGALLCYNRRRYAELEVKWKQSRSMAR